MQLFYSLFFLFLYISFSLPGNIIFFIFSGYFFDLFIGFFINIFCIAFGSLNFFIYSKFIFKFFFKTTYNKYSKRITSIINKSSFEYLILLRLLPGPPLFAQNVCLSLLNISKIKFILSTFIGFFPLMFICSFIGSRFSSFYQLQNFNINQIFSFEYLILIFFLIIILLFKIFLKNK